MTPTHRCAVRMTKQCRVSSVCVVGIQCQVSLLFSTHLWTALQPAKVFVLVLFKTSFLLEKKLPVSYGCLSSDYWTVI